MKKFLRLFLCCLFLSFGLFADNARFGLNTHNFPNWNSDTSINLFNQLNVKWIRAEIPWHAIEKFQYQPIETRFDFTEVDTIFNYAQENYINILFILTSNPIFYSIFNTATCLDPQNIDKWTAFVTAMVERYDGDHINDMPDMRYDRPVIKHWELWNEPNLNEFWNCGNEDLDKVYFVERILIPGIAAIRAADPEAKICGPDLSNLGYDHSASDPRNPNSWLSYITDRVGVVFDVLTHHPYEDNASKTISSALSFYTNAVGYGGREFWITEVGWPVSNTQATTYMREVFDYMLAYSWLKKTFWYAWIDNGTKMGIFDPDTTLPNNLYYTFKHYTNPRFVTVVSPNGGESWVRGSTYNIQWTSSNDITDVKIELIKGTTGEAPGVVDTIISSSTPAATGSYSWTISSTQTIGSDYSIRISPVPQPPIPGPKKDVIDSSDANFSINSAAPVSVTILTPNGGESWSDGSAHNITWMSTGQIANVKIEYSIDNGASYRLITNSTGNNGSYPWNVGAPFSSGCLVKISDAANPEIGDSSDAIFELFPSVPTYFTIIATAGTGGTISPAGSVQVIQGHNQTFTFPPSSGYGLQSVIVDNDDVTTLVKAQGNQYTFENVQTNHSIAVTFAILPTYTITPTAGAGGTIDPSEVRTVIQGTNQIFTITANSCYGVQSVTADGDDVTAYVMTHNNQYPFNDVRANHNIAATFAPLPTYTITPTAGSGGTINPQEDVIICRGANQTFTITPDPGYGIQSVTVDGDDVTAWVKAHSKQYPFNNVQANHTIAATFAILPTYTITATAGAGGTINPMSATVTEGGNQTFTITANSGYAVYSVTVDGENQGVRTSYTFEDVQTNHTIAATFALALTPPSYTGAMYWLNAFGYENGWDYTCPRMTADVNGDGKVDIVGFFNDGVYVALATGMGFTPAQRWVAGFGGDNGWWIGWHIRTMADVNGDGKADVVGFGNVGVYVSLSTGTSFTEAEYWSSSFGIWAQSGGWELDKHPRYMADVNGDGKLDVVGFGNDGVYVALSTGSAFTSTQKWVNGFGINDGWNVSDHPRLMADINGDGKADVVGFGIPGVIVALSNGSGFTAPAEWVGNFGVNQGWSSQHLRILADVNGDGKKDVVGFYSDGVYVSLSSGTGFTPMQKWVDDYGSNGGWDWNKPRFLADANGDGRADVIGFGTDGVRVSLSTGTGFMSSVLVVNFFGTDAGWSENFYPRIMADINGDGKADVVGFHGYGVWVSLSTTTAPLPVYTITATAGAGGTISPPGSVVVTQGTNQTFTIAANSGYGVQSVMVDGVSQGAISSYSFNNIQTDHTIAVTFIPAITYTITTTAGAGGTISPSGSINVSKGTNASFSIQPVSAAYRISQILLDGSAVAITNDSGQTVPINNIQSNHTVSAIFVIRTFTVTIINEDYSAGYLDPAAGTHTVNYGSNLTIHTVPYSRFTWRDATIDGVFSNLDEYYTFSNITSNHTYFVRFIEK